MVPPNGDYLISLVTPDGATAIFDVDGAANGNDLIAVSLSASPVSAQDFLLEIPASISGTIQINNTGDALVRFATGSARPQIEVTRRDDGQWEVSVPRRADRFAPLVLEVSENLRDWRAADEAHFEIVRQTPSGLVLRRPVSGAQTAAPPLFFRLAVSAP